MRILGFIFLALVISGSVMFISYNLGNGFLADFLNNEFIGVYATVVGFNLAAVIFLISQLVTIEEKKGAEVFFKTKKEIKHNSYYLLFSLPVVIFILSIKPSLINPQTFVNNPYYYVCDLVVLSLFVLTIFAIFEILNAMFILNKKNFVS